MSENPKNNNQYTAADIQRYLNGQMSAEEMHAMETAALDDPFLSDAIEGYETALKSETQEAISFQLQQLNRELQAKVKKPARVVPLYQSTWWKISAAAAVLLIVTVALINNWMGSEKTAEPILAVTEKRQTDTAITPDLQENARAAPERETLTQPVPNKTQSTPQAASEPNRLSKTAIPPGNDAAGLLSDEKKTEPKLKNEEISSDTSVALYSAAEKAKQDASVHTPVAGKENSEQKKDIASVGITEASSRRNNQLSAQLNNFSGRVVDQNNNPLPYASVQIMQNKSSVVTDQSGNFNFATPDTVVDVQVALLGFEQRNFRLQNNLTSNKLVLEPNKQNMDEVVVSGYGSERKKAGAKTTVKVQGAVPVIGWIDYEKYLESNKQPPASNPLLKGESVISFTIKNPGGISDFTIEKSLSADHDKEATRLIREGPAWKILHGRKARITVIVKF